MQQHLNVLQLAFSWLRLVGRQLHQLLLLFNLCYLFLLHRAHLTEQLAWSSPADNHPWVDVRRLLLGFICVPFSFAHYFSAYILRLCVECIPCILFLLQVILESLLFPVLELLILLNVLFIEPVLLNLLLIRHLLLLLQLKALFIFGLSSLFLNLQPVIPLTFHVFEIFTSCSHPLIKIVPKLFYFVVERCVYSLHLFSC